MKKTLLIALGCLAWLTCSGWSEPPQSTESSNPNATRRGWFRGGARGQGATGEQSDGRRGKAQRHERMAKFDTNGDGQLDDSERQLMREQMKARHKERFAQFDTNGDGQLDEAERQALREKMGGKHRERFAQFDTNGDGRLDDGERQALKQKMIQRFDKNGNGQIDPDERPQRGHRRRHKRGGQDGPGPEMGPEPTE